MQNSTNIMRYCVGEIMNFENYKNFGKCAVFEKNGIVARVTVDVGPRIIYYGTHDFNFLCEDVDRNVCKDGEFFDLHYGKSSKWFLYGGHRVWKSKEDLETYTVDNSPVDVVVCGQEGSFFSPVTPFGLQFGFDLKMNDDGSLNIKNRIKNYEKARELSIWSITVLAKGGTLNATLNKAESEFLPKQNYVFWEYSNVNDERLKIDEEKLILKQTSKDKPFKIGMFLNENKVCYHLNGKTLNFEYQQKTGTFGDYGCNFESYTNEHILETESLGNVEILPQNGEITLNEKWFIS